MQNEMENDGEKNNIKRSIAATTGRITEGLPVH